MRMMQGRNTFQKHHSHMKGFQYTTAGLVVNPLYPYLGATPDGLIKCQCYEDGLIEIKCP